MTPLLIIILMGGLWCSAVVQAVEHCEVYAKTNKVDYKAELVKSCQSTLRIPLNNYTRLHQAFYEQIRCMDRKERHANTLRDLGTIWDWLDKWDTHPEGVKKLILDKLKRIDERVMKMDIEIRIEMYAFREALNTFPNMTFVRFKELYKAYHRNYHSKRRAEGIRRMLTNKGIRRGL